MGLPRPRIMSLRRIVQATYSLKSLLITVQNVTRPVYHLFDRSVTQWCVMCAYFISRGCIFTLYRPYSHWQVSLGAVHRPVPSGHLPPLSRQLLPVQGPRFIYRPWNSPPPYFVGIDCILCSIGLSLIVMTKEYNRPTLTSLIITRWLSSCNYFFQYL